MYFQYVSDINKHKKCSRSDAITLHKKILFAYSYDLDHNPTGWSNWIVKLKLKFPYYLNLESVGGLIVGGYPRNPEFEKLLDIGVDCFIDLTLPEEKEKHNLLNISLLVLEKSESGELMSNVAVIQYPTKDRRTMPDYQVVELVMKMYQWYIEGKLMYLHCRGGHGRAGVIAACFLMLKDQISSDDALKIVQEQHSTRTEYTRWKQSPQTKVQFAQVHRLQKELYKE